MNRFIGGLLILLALWQTACSTQPQQRVSRACNDCVPRLLLQQNAIPLQSYWRNGIQPGKRLHIYLEGDGRPWIGGRYPSRNPTSRNLTALALMRQDSASAVYINRPCYGVFVLPKSCEYSLWTSGRYSDEVVEILDAAISEAKAHAGAVDLVLMGHSGGGTLAMLLAARRKDVTAVITLGANLDIEAWAQQLGYLPLADSLNPARLAPLPREVLRWHYAAANDRSVPPQITAEVAKADPLARFVLLPKANHLCCWQTIWPEVLEELDASLQAQESLVPEPTGTK